MESAAPLPEADYVIAADSGVEHAIDAGFVVDVVVGDLDSASAEANHQCAMSLAAPWRGRSS